MKKNLEDVGRRVDADSDASEASMPEYDFVVVGGGTAGCVLAARLSEDPKISVLLLEAGGSGKSILESRIPPGYPRLFHSNVDYDLYTVEQPNADGRKRYWPRAKMLGGCSSMNAQMFHAGAPTDYDEWAKTGLEGAEGWAFAEFQKYFLKFEKFVPHKLFPKVDASLHSSSGPVEVGYFGNFSKFSSTWIDACAAVGIPHVADVNTVSGTLGATKIMTYVSGKGERVSTETAYLTPEVIRRPNLTVATYAQVSRILFDTADGEAHAVGIEFARGKGTPRYRVKARKEVALCAGAVHTPHILMLSGIGPAAHLADKAVPVVYDLPGVGKHLMDHAAVNLIFRLTRGASLMYLEPRTLVEQLRMLPRLVQWLLTGKGPFTTNVAEAAAFVRSDDPALFPPAEFGEAPEDLTSSANAPDVEMFSSPFGWRESCTKHPDVPMGDIGTICAVLLRPKSTGSITLSSADPFEQPIIDPNYFASPHDATVLARGVHLALRTAHASALSGLVVHDAGALDGDLHGSSIPDLECAVRARAETLYHPTSTARMAPRAAGGVVDARLRVHGVRGLRVVDASVFPTIVAGHTAAPTIAVAEKAADMMKEDLSA